MIFMNSLLCNIFWSHQLAFWFQENMPSCFIPLCDSWKCGQIGTQLCMFGSRAWYLWISYILIWLKLFLSICVGKSNFGVHVEEKLQEKNKIRKVDKKPLWDLHYDGCESQGRGGIVEPTKSCKISETFFFVFRDFPNLIIQKIKSKKGKKSRLLGG